MNKQEKAKFIQDLVKMKPEGEDFIAAVMLAYNVGFKDGRNFEKRKGGNK